VTHVEEVEHAVGEDDATALAQAPARRAVPGTDLPRRIHGSGLEWLVRGGMKREDVIEERQLHPLTVVAFDVDLPRIARPGDLEGVGRVRREPDVLNGRLEPAPDGAVVD